MQQSAAAKLPPNPHPTMEDFLSKLDQLIAEQDLSVIEIIGVFELTKVRLLNDVMEEAELLEIEEGYADEA